MSEEPRTDYTPSVYMVGTKELADAASVFWEYGWDYAEDIEDADVVVFLDSDHDVMPYLYGDGLRVGTKVSLQHDLEYITNLRSCNIGEQVLVGIGTGAQFLNVMVGNGKLWQHVTDHNDKHTIINTTDGTCLVASSKHRQVMIPGSQGDVVYRANHKPETRRDCDNKLVPYEANEPGDAEVIMYHDSLCLCFQPLPYIPLDYNKACTELFFHLLSHYLNDEETSLLETQAKERE